MATLNELVGILSERSQRTFDIPFQEELKVIIDAVRIKLMKDSLTKRPQDRLYFLSSFVAPIKSVSKIECPITYGCSLRSADVLPSPIRANGILFDFVGSADFEIPFSMGGDWKETYFKHNKYTSGNTRYVYRDGYIFIKDNERGIEYIGIQMIVEYPLSLRKFKCLNGNGLCDFDDSQYPIAGDLIDALLNNILQTKLGVILPKEKVEVKVNEDTN